MAKKHENYKELIWTLAKTDFTLRYHGSFLGYIWALLKPMLTFAILYFVFSSIFNPRNTGQEFYALELLLGIILFTFFAEGTSMGMNSLMAKAQLVTKIYVPRWALIVSSTLNAGLVFAMNLVILVVFFAWNQFLPSVGSMLLFILFAVLTYILTLAFSLIAAPLYVRFRDLSLIWDVIVGGLFYATPIIYPLSLMPDSIQRILLINPMGFVVHFSKTAMIEGHFPDAWQLVSFAAIVVSLFAVSILCYRFFSKSIAERI